MTTSTSQPPTAGLRPQVTIRAVRAPYGSASFAQATCTHGAATAGVHPLVAPREQVRLLGHDLLTSLGHPGTRVNEAQNGTALQLLPAYLSAHRISDVVVRGAERLRGDETVTLLRRTLTDLAPHPLTLWLLVEPPSTLTIELDELALADEQWSRLPEGGCRAPVCAPETLDSEERAVFPPVPSDDILTFPLACEQLLAPGARALVRKTLMAAAGRALHLLPDSLPGGSRHDPRYPPSPISLVTHHLRLEIEAAGSVDEALTRVRGVQLALFDLGWWLTVDLDQFVKTYLAAAPARTASAADWAKLKAFRPPLIAAITTLAAAGISRAGLENVRLRDLAPDSSHIADAWRVHPVPHAGRLFLDVQRAHLERAGAAPHTPLASIVTVNGHIVKATTAQVTAALRAPAEQLHVQLHNRPRQWADRTEQSWSRRWGVNLLPISGQARRSQK